MTTSPPMHLVPAVPDSGDGRQDSGTNSTATISGACVRTRSRIDGALPVTILDLALDPTFDPVFVGPRVTNPMQKDVKPWRGYSVRKSRNMRERLRQAMRCCVCGGAPYTLPDASGRRVCPYCRADVIELRQEMCEPEPVGPEVGAA
jgi:hypothetical protein